MTLVCKLENGWRLEADQGYPVFIHKDGRRRNPFEFSKLPEARTNFRAVKRWLDVADVEFGHGAGADTRWRAADKAKLALQMALMNIGIWREELLDTEVDENFYCANA